MRTLLVIISCLVVFGGLGAATAGDGPGETTAQTTLHGGAIDSAHPPLPDVTTDAGHDDDQASPSADADGELEIHHIDVGQADSTLLITPSGETILIDSGDWRPAGREVIAYLEAHDIDRIDHLVATHGHADHIGGHAAVIEWAETEGDGIGAAYDPGVPHDTATYERYLDAIEEHDVELFLVESGDELPVGDQNVTARVVNPPANASDHDLHTNSMALVFEIGEFRYVTTGDAEVDAEEHMVDAWEAEINTTVYQVGHHGSSSSSSSSFMDATSPEIAVISSAYESQYGHPHDEVLEDFANRRIETYWTGVHGDVVVATDGTDVWIQTENGFSSDPADLLDAKPAENDERRAVIPGLAIGPAAVMVE